MKVAKEMLFTGEPIHFTINEKRDVAIHINGITNPIIPIRVAALKIMN